MTVARACARGAGRPGEGAEARRLAVVVVRADASVQGSSGKRQRVIVNLLESAIRDRIFEPFFQGGPARLAAAPAQGSACRSSA